MGTLPAWAYVVVIVVAPAAWAVLAARGLVRRDRRARARDAAVLERERPPVDYSI